MKITLLVRLAILLLTISMLSGCIWWVGDDGYRRGDGRGGRHEEHHERHEDHGGHH